MERKLIIFTVLVVVIFIGFGIFILKYDSDNSTGEKNAEDNLITTGNNNSSINHTLQEKGNANPVSGESTIIREFSSFNPKKDEEIEVTLYIHVANDEDYYFIEEYVPEGWTVTDDKRGETENPYRLAWYTFGSLFSSGDTSLTYKVKAPSKPGIYNFDGIYLFEGMDKEETTKGQTQVTVT